MHTLSRRYAPLTLILTAVLLLAGCASVSKSERLVGTSATLQNVEDDYRQAQLQTAATEEALDAMLIAQDADLEQAFDSFTLNRNRMEQIGSRLIAHADGMFFRGTYYFVESGKTMDSCALPRAGKAAGQRSVDLGEDFAAVSEAGGEIKRAFRAFQLDIEQIHDYLDDNLTPSGLDTMEQIVRKAKVDSESLQESLQEALAVLGRARTSLQQGAQKKG
jgi:outer membrane murein-binding lipoprotein Lpp